LIFWGSVSYARSRIVIQHHNMLAPYPGPIRPARGILARLAGVLCKILYPNFGEFLF
jgi:hypothetical protein